MSERPKAFEFDFSGIPGPIAGHLLLFEMAVMVNTGAAYDKSMDPTLSYQRFVETKSAMLDAMRDALKERQEK